MSDTRQPNHFVVGIGASAGGLEALERFFEMTPIDVGVSYVIIQHLSPDFKSMMSELLARHTDLPIELASEGLDVQPNRVYLIPARKEMRIEAGRLHLVEKNPSTGLSLPINIFFKSLAADYGDRAIGIVLSGTGSDGREGIQAIRAAGGLVLAQSEDSAKFDSMPKAAIESGAVHLALEPGRMPHAIVQYVRSPVDFDVSKHAKEATNRDEVPQSTLMGLLKDQFGTDFRNYKPTTVTRRIQRRQELGGFETLSDYFGYLVEDPEERNRLYRDLLIGVTKFFRDREAFDRLASEVIPPLVSAMSAENEIRVWCAGCASGEEAYSLAILFHEEARKQGVDLHLKLFATDIHADSIAVASKGQFPAESVSEVPEDLLRRYFVLQANGYVISPEIRKRIVLTRHDVVSDPPFTRVHLLTCRNMLIYFISEVQHRVLAAFHFALTEGGSLFLGPSETLGELSYAFDSVDHHWKLFRKRAGIHLPPHERMPVQQGPLTTEKSRGDLPGHFGRRLDKGLLRAYDKVLDRYVPAGFLIDEHRNLVHAFGDGSKLLKTKTGRFSSDLLDLLDSDIRVAVAAALQRAQREHKSILFKSTRVSLGDNTSGVFDLRVEPLLEGGAHYTLIVLERDAQIDAQLTPPVEFESLDLDEASRQRVSALETELRYTKENLQATIEELETSNEELQSTNEEMVASNEELQSTNEELHSVNEELYTVNSEYQKKIDELTQLSNDMENLLASTDIGTIFLDRDLRIRKFTPAAREAFNLLPTDIGRKITHFSHSFDLTDLVALISAVLDTGETLEREVSHNQSGESYLLKLVPYRTLEGGLEGVVLTFVDIAAVKSVQEELERRQSELEVFTAMAAHDLKAPLRRITQTGDFLVDSVQGGDKEETIRWIDAMQESAKKMIKLIDDLLRYARMDLGDIQRERVDLAALVDQVRGRLALLIADSRAVVECPERYEMWTDKTAVSHLLDNLISNAIRYRHPERTPVVRVDCEVLGDEYLLTVRDNGIGISPDNYAAVFRPFRRCDGSDRVEGSGFGLAICKRIAERLGGKIWFDSVVGEGTTFYLRLPALQPDEQHERRVSYVPGRPIRILHLDDDPAEAEIVSRYLKKSALTEVDYEHFSEVGAFLERAQEDPAHLLLIDYDLKQAMNGLETLRALRASGCATPAILLSGIATDAILKEYKSAGGTDALNKAELNPAVITRLVEDHLVRDRETT